MTIHLKVVFCSKYKRYLRNHEQGSKINKKGLWHEKFWKQLKMNKSEIKGTLVFFENEKYLLVKLV